MRSINDIIMSEKPPTRFEMIRFSIYDSLSFFGYAYKAAPFYIKPKVILYFLAEIIIYKPYYYLKTKVKTLRAQKI